MFNAFVYKTHPLNCQENQHEYYLFFNCCGYTVFNILQ